MGTSNSRETTGCGGGGGGAELARGISLSNVYVELETFLFFCYVVRQVIAVVSFMLVAFGVYLSVTLCCVRRAFNEYVYWVSLDARTHTATGTGGRQQSGLSDWGTRTCPHY